MSLWGKVLLPGSSQYFAASPCTLFPFLYQTQTIQGCGHGHLPRRRRSQRPFSSSSYQQADYDAIPFESSLERTVTFTPALRSLSKIRKSRDSTITNSEQAVFDRIFQDIASASPTQHHELNDDPDSEDGAYFEDLDQIFENAISKSERSEEAAEQTAGKERLGLPEYQRHPLIQNVPGLGSLGNILLPTNNWGLPGRIGSEAISNLSTAHGQHRAKVFGMFDAAQTDVEVWRVLETEVFTLVHELNARIKEAEKSAKSKKSKITKAGKEISSAGVAKVGRPSKQSIAAAKVNETTTPKALPPTVLLSILTKEYPLYLVAGCRLFAALLSPEPLPARHTFSREAARSALLRFGRECEPIQRNPLPALDDNE